MLYIYAYIQGILCIYMHVWVEITSILGILTLTIPQPLTLPQGPDVVTSHQLRLIDIRIDDDDDDDDDDENDNV
ncbi:hypothetical protein M0802_005015 [Mischocyttarus mexicanus]|nr:hypothetical protein M0802_005015 [Mischocyttarus mexicanus]